MSNFPASGRSAHKFPAARLAVDALLIALYFALGYLAEHMEIAGVRISFVALPLVVGAVLYGPIDAALVGFLGELIAQMLAWGFSATTLLWCIPETVRGLLLGLGVVIFAKQMSVDAITKGKRLAVYFAICIVAAIATSLANTAVYYVDSKIYGYYNAALIFGVMWVRILTGVGTAVATGVVAIPLLSALKSSKLANL